jgi:hypothetical protein
LGKFMVGRMRFFLLCALGLALPSLAAAQCSPVITVQRAWTQDTGGKEKTQFAPGETLQFAALVSSNYGGSGQTQLAITTSFYNDTGYALKAGQLTYDCRYSTMHGMPITGGRGFRGLKPLWYNSVPP